MTERAWCGADFLDTISGPASRFPPLRVLFLAHRVAATGRLDIRTISRSRQIHVLGGTIVSVVDFPDLLHRLDVLGEPGADMVTLVGAAIGRGYPSDRAIAEAIDGLARALGALAEPGNAEVRFDTNAGEPRAKMPVGEAIPRLITRGLREVRPVERLRAIFAPRLRNPVMLSLPDDAPERRWGLPAMASRLLREAASGPTLGDLLGVEAGPEPAFAVDLLMQLGLLYVEGAPTGARPAAAQRPATTSVPPPQRTLEPRAPAARSLDPRPPQQRPDDPRSVEPRSSGPRSVEPRPAEPRPVPTGAKPMELGAALRPDLELLRQLREALAAMEGADPAAVLGLTRSADITDAGVDRAFREQSKRFHPDRHMGVSADVEELAARCFALVNEAAAALRQPALLKETQARLKAAEEGRIYVTEAEARSARIAFLRGDIALKAKRFTEALVDLEDAERRDPTVWRHTWARVQAALGAGTISGPDATLALAPLVERAPAGAARADILFQLGELSLKEGREAEAYARFEEALKEHPDHLGAKRRVWLRQRRADEATPSVSGILGGLLGRKK